MDSRRRRRNIKKSSAEGKNNLHGQHFGARPVWDLFLSIQVVYLLLFFLFFLFCFLLLLDRRNFLRKVEQTKSRHAQLISRHQRERKTTRRVGDTGAMFGSVRSSWQSERGAAQRTTTSRHISLTSSSRMMTFLFGIDRGNRRG